MGIRCQINLVTGRPTTVTWALTKPIPYIQFSRLDFNYLRNEMNAYDQSREALRLLKSLPAEILSQIISNLPNIDIKNLRQTYICFKDIARPRINRLFLSTNLKDIQVFRAVADHEFYRYEVTEIIYDDVRFSHADDIDSESDYDIADNIGDATGAPSWFCDLYRKLSQQQ